MNTPTAIAELEQEIDQLKRSYDLYFQGEERLEPIQKRQAVRATIRQLRTEQVNSTRNRFRLNNLVARFNSFENYWNRIVRQIEEGTFKRDVRRARALLDKHQQKSIEPASAAQTAAPKTRPMDHYRDVYNQFIQTRAQYGQKGSISFDKLKATLEKQHHTLKSKYKVNDIQFKVVVQDGKAVVKAVPQK